MKRIVIELTEEVSRLFKAKCALLGVTMKVKVPELINKYLKDEQSVDRDNN